MKTEAAEMTIEEFREFIKTIIILITNSICGIW